MENSFDDFHRGEIYIADLNPYFDGTADTRPVLVLLNNVGNLNSSTVVITPVVHQGYKRNLQPTHVALDAVEGLETALFKLEDIRHIDKRRIREYVGELTEEQMECIDAALRVSLRLDEDAFLPVEMEAP